MNVPTELSDVPESAVITALGNLSSALNVNSLNGIPFLLAVSGGADSMTLLCLMHRLAGKYGYQLSVITVNHMIRPKEESTGDSQFVSDFCASLNPPVPCHTVTLEGGAVAAEASRRGRGIEDAARHIRYNCFRRYAASISAPVILTAHTRTDQLETILMRFFQGAGSGSLGGISPLHLPFFRPLLEVDRQDILAWLRREGIPWREDTTNTDESYLRNRIRGSVVPALETLVKGWDTGVLNAGKKARMDDEFCQSCINIDWKKSDSGLECSSAEFVNLHPALRLRFLQSALVLLGVDHRVSFALLKNMSEAPEQSSRAGHEGFRVSGSGLCFRKVRDSLFFGPDIVQNGKSGYLVYIYACGFYCFPFGTISVSEKGNTVFLDEVLGPFSLPLTVRSRMAGDSVETAGGKRKTLKKLMNDWSIPVPDRNSIPVIEQAGIVRAVYGSKLGYRDWYVNI